MATKKTELAKKDDTTTALTHQRESFIAKGDTTGTEGISANDLRLPRLGIAQGLSPQMNPDDSQYIDGLRQVEMFNDMTSVIYGRGPLTFIVLRRDVRGIEFIPRSDGGGIKDFNVPLENDPEDRWSWRNGEGPDGTDLPPKATRYDEFVIWMLDPEQEGETYDVETILLSIKNTNKWNRRAAQNLTGFLKLLQKPVYAGIYTIESKPEKNDSGSFGVPVIKQAGVLDDQKVDDAEWARRTDLFRRAEAFAKSLKGKNIVANREPGDEDYIDGDVDGGDKPPM